MIASILVIVVVGMDFAKVVVVVFDTMEEACALLVFFARVEVPDWRHTKNRKDRRLMIGVLSNRVGCLVDNFEDKRPENRSGSYRIAKAPS